MQTPTVRAALATGAPLPVSGGRRHVRWLDACASTNQLARGLVPRFGAGTLVGAEHQTAGRGRLGRVWQAEPGQNLLFSLVLRPGLPATQAPCCVLVWAAALAEALGVYLKWPNDLVGPDDRKLGGLLAELEPGPGGLHVVLGVGLNINQTRFPGLPTATSLAELRGGPQDRLGLLVALVAAVEAVQPGAPDGLDRWRARARTLGRRVQVNGREGIAQDIRDDGALMVDGVPVLAGDVSLLG